MKRTLLILSFIILAAASALLSGTHGLAHAGQAGYEKAVALLGAGNAEEAASLLAPLAKSDPGNPYVHYHLGLAYYKLGRLDDALGAFDAARQAAGGSAETEFGLSAAYSNTGVAFYRKKLLDEANECFERAVSLNEKDGTSRYYMGLVALAKGEHDAARAELERAASLMAGDKASLASIRNAVAISYAGQEMVPEAIREFEATLDIDPGNVEALYNLGVLTYKQDGYEAARPYFDMLTAEGAKDDSKKGVLFTAIFNMGVDFQDRGKTTEAAGMFERAALIMPDDAQSHYYLGYNLMQLGRYADAAGSIGRALELDPGMESAKARYEVARKLAADEARKNAEAKMAAGDFYAALPLYGQALGFDPSDEDASKGRDKAASLAAADTDKRAAKARGLLEKGEYEAARREADELAALNPDSAAAAGIKAEVESSFREEFDALANKALAAEKDGALGEAAGLYEAMLKLDPGDARAAASLKKARAAIASERAEAKSAMAQGRLSDARKSYERLLVYVPGDADAQDGLEELRYRVGMEKERETARAQEALEAGDLVTAVSHADRALELSPNDKAAMRIKADAAKRKDELAAGYVSRGEKMLGSGEYGEAGRLFNEALSLDPDNEAARDGLERAKRAAAAPKDEDEIRRLYLSGVEHYTSGELEEAVAAWRGVLKLDPGNEKAASSIKKAEEKMQSAGQGR